MDLLNKLKGLAALGFANVGRAVRYAANRDRIERRWPVDDPGDDARDPGAMRSFQIDESALAVEFDGAELELSFLAPDLVRVTWQPGARPEPYALSSHSWPGAAIEVEEDETGAIRAISEAVQVTIAPDGALTFADKSGRVVRREYAPRRTGRAWEHRAEVRPEEAFYGLGERTTPLNLRGHSYRMWNMEPMGSYDASNDAVYICIPVYLGLHDGGAYLVFFENSFDATISFRDQARARFCDGALRYYLCVGPVADLYRRYGELTGTAPLPPRWALGYHQARWSYETQEEVRQIARGFRERDFPLSAIHLDIHYLDGYRVFTVDRDRFPDLRGLSGELAAQGVRLVAILDPGVKCDGDYALFREGSERGLFCATPDGEVVHAPVWPGWCAFPDFTSAETRAWWGSKYELLREWGIAGAWHDMNEPAAFAAWKEPTLPLPTRHAFDGRGGDHREAHNLYALLEARAGYEGLREHIPERRPLIISRSGWAGMQRYAWSWTGDCESNWWTLAQTVRMVLGMGLSGAPYTGPDIGGFGGTPTAELYARWFQLSTFLPLFRTHSACFVPRREPWSFGDEVLEIARQFAVLRYRLLPFLYTLAWRVSQTGHPFNRPLFWSDEQDAGLRDVDDQFMLGDDLLVAPVLEEGARQRRVVLPRGRWYDFWTDAIHEGPGVIDLAAPLETIPLLVRGGAIVPMERDGNLELHVFPAEDGCATGLLYDDEGDGFGVSRVDQFDLVSEGGHYVLTHTKSGDHLGSYDAISIRFRGPGSYTCVEDGVASTGDNGFATGWFERLVFERRD